MEQHIELIIKIVTALAAFPVAIYALIRAFVVSPFDRATMQKERRIIYLGIQYLIFLFFINFYIYFVAFTFPLFNLVVFLILISVFVISLFLLMVHWSGVKKKPLRTRQRGFIFYIRILATATYSSLILLIGGIVFLLIKHLNSDYLFFQMGVAVFILSVGMLLGIYFYFNRYDPPLLKSRYRLRLKVEDRYSTYYILHRYDANHLLLGDKRNEWECNELLLYHTENEKVTSIEVVREPIKKDFTALEMDCLACETPEKHKVQSGKWVCERCGCEGYNA